MTATEVRHEGDIEGRSKTVRATPYNWPHDGSFSPQTTALIVVDMQRDFCEDGGYLTSQGYSIDDARTIISPILHLLQTFSKANYPIYFTREGHRPDLSTLSSREHTRSRNNRSGIGIGDRSTKLGRCLVRGEPGWEVIPEFAKHIQPSETNVVDKPGRSAFAHTELELMLRLRGVKNLVLCGVTTDVCVHSTMREANDRGFDCLLVGDACAAATEDLHRSALESVKSEGGIFGSTSTVEHVIEALS